MNQKNIPYNLSNDFLKTAQNLDSLIVEVDKESLINSFDHKFCSLGSCFAQNLQTFIQPFRFNFYFNRQVFAYYH